MTSVTPDRGSLMGGTEVTILGEGFPLDAKTKDSFSLKFGYPQLEIKEINNHKIVAIIPEA